jgi:hypothetical protein
MQNGTADARTLSAEDAEFIVIATEHLDWLAIQAAERQSPRAAELLARVSDLLSSLDPCRLTTVPTRAA